MRKKYSLGDKAADMIAKFGGSWLFIFIFMGVLGSWTTYNYFAKNPFDGYPFIFLNLLLSCLAAIQAPVILMANNRQSEIDRKLDREDFKLDKDTNKKIDKILELLLEKK
jgi:uncharacterized membrane protein